MSELVVSVSEQAPAVVVKVAGEAKMNVSALDSQVTRLLAMKPALLVLDLGELTFCSSLGMGCFVALRRSLERSGCRIRLAALPPMVLDSFKRARLLPLFETYPSVAEAIAAPLPPPVAS